MTLGRRFPYTLVASHDITMRVSLDHIHIFSSNIQVTMEFFIGMLGAAVVWDEDAAGARTVRLALGRGFIHVYDQPPKGERAGAIHHVGVETDDLDGLVAHMKAKGFEFRKPVREEARFRYVMVAGPDGLLIELFQSLEPERWQIGLAAS